MRNKAWRILKSKSKGERRIKEDKQQHRIYGNNTLEQTCICFGVGAKRDVGRMKSRFTDYPASCSCWMCTNPRKAYKGDNKNSLTFQEIKANIKQKEFLKGDY